VRSIYPYSAVGCGRRIFVKDEKVVPIERDPDSPVSRGRSCPKGSASEQLVNSPHGRAMLYRRPYSTEWEPVDRRDGHRHDRRPLARIAGQALAGTPTTRAGCGTA